MSQNLARTIKVIGENLTSAFTLLDSITEKEDRHFQPILDTVRRLEDKFPMFEEVNINNCQRMQTIISECFERVDKWEFPKFNSQILIDG